MLVKKSLPNRILEWILDNPSRMIVSSFLLVIFVGSILLALPFSTYAGHHLDYFEALFTAVSATCVTGLIVADTATTFTLFGKIVLICLIQIGGLGLVTIASFIFSFTRKKLDIRSKMLQLETSGSFSFKEAPTLLKYIFGVTFAVEFIGGCLLSIAYIPKFGVVNGLGKAFFQSISAYCNAGFDLLGNTEAGAFSSLTGFYNSTLVIIVTAFLILFGGLGFTVWVDLFGLFKKRKMRVHSKIVLEWTLGLTLFGFIFLLLVESFNAKSMGDFSFKNQALSAFFQSVSFRTAGFNSIDLAAMTDASKTVAIILMLIGAGSGSTGGGIKITTFAILIYAVISELRGEESTITHKSKIPSSLVRRALALFTIGIVVVSALSIVISMFEYEAIANGSFSFIDIVFEATSAFATVGLSTCGTPTLTIFSKIFIIPAMFLGRVGPLSLAVSLTMKGEKKIGKVLPESKIHIG